MLRPDAAPATGHLPEVKGNRSQRRMARLVSPLLRRVLKTTEHSLTVVEATRVVGWKARLTLGASWPFANRVALVFTERRLLEVALGPGARTTTGEIREIAWSNVARPRIEGNTLCVGEHHKWWLRHPVERAVLLTIDKNAGETSTPLRRGASIQEWRLCIHCGGTMRDRDRSCQRCGARRHSPGLARFLSLAFPGAGMLYLARPSYAVTRFFTELVLWLVFAERMLRADGFAMRILVTVFGAVILILVKWEGLRMTRALSERASVRANTREPSIWRRRAIVGALVSIVFIALPLVFAGSLSSRITGDLNAEAEHLGWQVNRNPSTWQSATTDMRAEWHHRDGLVVRALARPLPPFMSADRARQAWTDTYGGDATTTLERIDLAKRQVLRITRVLRPPGQAPHVELRYVLMDEYGRDEHTLEADFPRSELDSAEHDIEELVASLYWIPAVQLATEFAEDSTE